MLTRFLTKPSAFRPLATRQISEWAGPAQNGNHATLQDEPKRILVSGAHSQIAYQMLFRIARGELLGDQQRVILHLLDVGRYDDVMRGMMHEIQDCCFPLVDSVMITSHAATAFRDTDYNFLLGGYPNYPGISHDEFLKKNASIYKNVGVAMNESTKRDSKTLVIGNPSNTNALVLYKQAKDLPPGSITALSRLAHNQAICQVASQAFCGIDDVRKVAVWGNASETLFADLRYATINDESIFNFIEPQWANFEFITNVQQRTHEIIKNRKLSPAGSVASAAILQMREWIFGTRPQDWSSFSIRTSGGKIGSSEELFFAQPCTVKNGVILPVGNVSIDQKEVRKRIDATTRELLRERRAVEDYL